MLKQLAKHRTSIWGDVGDMKGPVIQKYALAEIDKNIPCNYGLATSGRMRASNGPRITLDDRIIVDCLKDLETSQLKAGGPT